MDSMSSARGYGLRGPLSGQKVGGRTIQQIPRFTPEQMDLFQNLFSHVGPESYLSRLAGGDEGLFSEIEQPALRRFSGLQGQIASRFSHPGMGGRRSSGFQNTMNQAAQDFASDLQSQRMNLQRQALSDLLGISNTLLDKEPFYTYQREPRKRNSFLKNLLGGAAPIVGGVLGSFGGPFGMALGSQIGSMAGSAIRGDQGSPLDFSSLLGLPTTWSSPTSISGQALVR